MGRVAVEPELAGPLDGPVDAPLAEVRDRLDVTPVLLGQQLGAFASEAEGEVPEDVGDVGADDPSGPPVAEDGRGGRAVVEVGARLVRRAERGVPAVGRVGGGGQDGERERVVESEEAVGERDAQTARVGRCGMEAVAVRHGVVAAVLVAADPPAEDGTAEAGRS